MTRFTGEPPPTTGTGTGAAVAQAMDQRICVSYKRLSGPWMSPTMHHPHHPVLPGGGGDGWCRRHSSTMVTRHYVLWVQQCPRLCTVVSSTVWMTVRGGGRRCVGFGWAKQQVPSPWGENQFKLSPTTTRGYVATFGILHRLRDPQDGTVYPAISPASGPPRRHGLSSHFHFATRPGTLETAELMQRRCPPFGS